MGVSVRTEGKARERGVSVFKIVDVNEWVMVIETRAVGEIKWIIVVPKFLML